MAAPLAALYVGGVAITRALATRLGPTALSALKKMDKTKARNLINKAKNLKDKSITEFKRSLLKLPKTTVRNKKKIEVGKAARRGIEQGSDKKLRTLRVGSKEGNVAKQPKVGSKDSSVIVRKPSGRLETITNKLKKTLNKNRSRVAKRKRKRAIVKTGVGAALTLPFLKDKNETKAKDSSVKLTNYTIKKGDTLSEIAKRTPGATLGQIKEANKNIEDLNKINPGQKIKIPGEIKDRESVYQDVDVSKITMKKRAGGPLQNIPAGNKGLPNLPTPVRNKMGFKKRGGKVIKKASGGLIGGGAALRGFGAIRKR